MWLQRMITEHEEEANRSEQVDDQHGFKQEVHLHSEGLFCFLSFVTFLAKTVLKLCLQVLRSSTEYVKIAVMLYYINVTLTF